MGNNKNHVITDSGEIRFRGIEITHEHQPIERPIVIGTIKVTSAFYKSREGKGRNKEKIADTEDKIYFIFNKDNESIWFNVESRVAARNDVHWCRKYDEVLKHGKFIEYRTVVFPITLSGYFGVNDDRTKCFFVPFGHKKHAREDSITGVWISDKFYDEEMKPYIPQYENSDIKSSSDPYPQESFSSLEPQEEEEEEEEEEQQQQAHDDKSRKGQSKPRRKRRYVKSRNMSDYTGQYLIISPTGSPHETEPTDLNDTYNPSGYNGYGYNTDDYI